MNHLRLLNSQFYEMVGLLCFSNQQCFHSSNRLKLLFERYGISNFIGEYRSHSRQINWAITIIIHTISAYARQPRQHTLVLLVTRTGFKFLLPSNAFLEIVVIRIEGPHEPIVFKQVQAPRPTVLCVAILAVVALESLGHDPDPFATQVLFGNGLSEFAVAI